MKIIKNEKLIKRNGTIANYTTLAALATLGAGMYISFAHKELFIYSLIALFLGFILTQIGMFMNNRFGPSPRPDERLDAGLKGLQNEFIIYHYTTPVSHLLIGPAGVWALMPYHQTGQITFAKNRWRNSGGGFIQSYMRIFGAGSLGRPDIEVESEVESLRRFFSKHMDESEIPEINALMVFTNDNVELDADGSPVPAMKAKQIKDFLRQKAKEKRLPAETLNQLKTVLES